MVKWAIPINPEKTLTHLLSALYSKICLRKISALQTPENIQFRSRSGFNTFPFDLTVFKRSSGSKRESSVATPSSGDSQTRFILPLDKMKRTLLSSHHIFDIALARENLEVTDLRLYIGLGAGMESVQYKLIVKIFDQDDRLLYFNTFEEHVFSQFAHPIKAVTTQVGHAPNADCLHIPHLSLRS